VAERRDEVDADESSELYLTPGFWRRYGPDLANYGILIMVDLRRDDADLAAFTEAVQRRLPGRAIVSPAEFVEGGTSPPPFDGPPRWRRVLSWPLPRSPRWRRSC
jgi:hypothetical protein